MATKDKNIVLLEGVIGDDMKFAKTSEGKEMCTFTFCVNAYMKDVADDTERSRSQTFIRIFVYDKKQLEYLHRVNVHRGQRASILGRLSSRKTEYRGIDYIQITVIVRDIGIIQTKSTRKSVITTEQKENDNEQKEDF